MSETNINNQVLEAVQPTEVDSCECCAVPENIEAPAKYACTLSGTLSNKVLRETLDSLIVHDKRHLIVEEVQYYFCGEPDCPVVYFSNEEVPAFERSDLSVKVFSKDNNENVNVCYCFDWTRKRITDQIKTTGRSTVFDEVTEEVKAGNCECERQNPKGACCLGDMQILLMEIT